MTIKEPTDEFVPGGKLKDCDICGFTWRENELVLQDDGYLHCPFDVDVEKDREEAMRITRREKS